jgi:hypothetical protein
MKENWKCVGEGEAQWDKEYRLEVHFTKKVALILVIHYPDF